MTTPISQRTVRLNPGEYRASLSELSAKTAADIAVAHRGMASWNHRYAENIAMAAWRQSLADAPQSQTQTDEPSATRMEQQEDVDVDQ